MASHAGPQQSAPPFHRPRRVWESSNAPLQAALEKAKCFFGPERFSWEAVSRKVQCHLQSSVQHQKPRPAPPATPLSAPALGSSRHKPRMPRLLGPAAKSLCEKGFARSTLRSAGTVSLSSLTLTQAEQTSIIQERSAETTRCFHSPFHRVHKLICLAVLHFFPWRDTYA